MTKHSQIIDTIDENITNGVERNVLHLSAENSVKRPNGLIINGQEMINFSSYSYLGLEKNKNLIQGCIDAVNTYGAQFGFSRAFISIDLYEELESLLSEIFENPVVVAPSTTLAHQAALPVLIRDNDAVIIDQQAHASMQMSVKMIRDRGVKVELVRHNRTDLIEEKILRLKQHYDKIWYLADGVYSMYGDYAPLKELEYLMSKYDQFHLYIDDAHGMSWTGNKGQGYVLSQMNLHPQMVLVTSLNKAFASAGGVLILPNNEWRRKIRTCGGTLIFSTPIQPPMLGTAVASAKLHLTQELEQLQVDLETKIKFCFEKINQLNLEDISGNTSPIFYLPTSFPKVSYNLVKKMMNEGYYITPTLFPAVSMRKAGLRFCVNANHTISEIDQMLSALAKHYPTAVHEEGVTLNTIYKSFNIEATSEIQPTESKELEGLQIEIKRKIHDVNANEWNDMLANNGTFDWNGLAFLENAFKNNEEKENNWEFYYYLVRDNKGKCILATFFTKCWCKDDIFKPAAISKSIEVQRVSDKYFLCTESLMMGCLLTEGNHLYLDRESAYWKDAFLLLFNAINDLQLKTMTNAVYLRDFDKEDKELTDLFIANGFVKTELPDYAHEHTHLEWKSLDEFMEPLGTKKRQQLRRDVLKYEDKYLITIQSSVSKEELSHYFKLYQNVKKGSFTINTFDLPFSVFEKMNENSNWEMIELKLRDDEHPKGHENSAIAVIFCYKSSDVYVPLLVGLNYDFKYSHKNYKQAVYQAVKRANAVGAKKLYFGVTASIEKRRVGAKAVPKSVFVQLQETYNMDVLEMTTAKDGMELVV